MQDKLYTYPIDKLLKWILREEKEGKIFGYYKNLFFKPNSNDPFKMKRYGRIIDTPVGVAAGPHTQLSQNIVLSWLFGARYIELKTVQVLDDIEVTKPCIDMYDEGYNCEWSQELSIEESYNQYLDAWILLHILSDKYGYDFATIFNISVGYDLKGIKTDKVKWFLRKIKDSSDELKSKVDKLSQIYPRIKDLNISSQISDNVTLSTMHGCPPAEIESIAKHLIEEWKLHTAVKLNPTIIGKAELTNILNSKLGYNINVPDAAFEHDLEFKDAKKIINELKKTAENTGVEFGIKLTNTLESLNDSDLLPKNENMVYMSGRALHPISVKAAALLNKEYNGTLDISFSGGADAFNFPDIIACNLKPVTVCSDFLKPGGYSRLPQYLANLQKDMSNNKVSSIDEFIISKSSKNKLIDSSLENLYNYAEKVAIEKRYNKSFAKHQNVKTSRELTVLDCVHPPCVETCAISQNVPGYLYHTANRNFEEAYKTIIEDNPLPNITGMVCDHLCQTKCTRMNIDNSILIREIKRFISAKESDSFRKNIGEQKSKRVAIIGSGPSGLSASYFLRMKGLEVDVYESHSYSGGMASSAIPKFRIDEASLKKDINDIEKLGVKFHYNETIDKIKFEKVKDEYDFVYIAVGAQIGKKLGIEGEDNEGVVDQLTFLENVKLHKDMNVGSHIAIIGGGNSAMDAARTAKRLVSEDGRVTLLYRRTKNEMPADKEEIEALVEENIEIFELTSPKIIFKRDDQLQLTCIKMKLGEPGESGRSRPIEIHDSEFTLQFDMIITAVGQEVNLDFLPNGKMEIDPITKETNIKNVFAGGDAVRGADSLINAISDGKIAAQSMLPQFRGNSYQDSSARKIELRDYQEKLSRRKYGENLKSLPPEKRNNFGLVNPLMEEDVAVKEASRCLYCDEVCNICVSVCPNLANQYYETEPFKTKYPIIDFIDGKPEVIAWNEFEVKQKYQIININDFCNECGNCETFCPTSGAPYKIKPKFALSEDSFNEITSGYYFKNDSLLFKDNGGFSEIKIDADKIFYSDPNYTLIFNLDFSLLEGKQKTNTPEVNSEKIIEMYYYLISLKENSVLIN